jgi:biopolymer transport protein ExbB/TolQ
MKNKVNHIANKTPHNLVRDITYWISFQKEFIFVLIVAIVIVLIFFPYTYSAPTSYTSYFSNLFNICIHSLGGWGVIVTAKAMATVEVEKAIANFIKKEGKDHLEKLRSGGSRIDLSGMEEKFLPQPHNQIKSALVMSRLFRHICKEAENLKFESSLDVIEPYRDESLESIFTISNIQKLALRFGILGTFIGLIQAISELTKIQTNEPVKLIQSLSGSLFISFSTSVAGLEVAIILSFLLMLLRKQQDVYFRDMESSVEIILTLARNANNDDQYHVLGELSQLNSLITKLGKTMYEHTKEVQHGIDATLNRINDQTNVIYQGIQQLKEAKSEFNIFLAEISQVQKQFIGEVMDIYQKLSLKEFQDGLKSSIIIAGNNVSNRVRQTEDLLQEHTAQIQVGIDELIDTRSQFLTFIQQIDDSQVRFIKNVREGQDTVSMLEANTELRQTINQTRKQIESVSRKIEELNNSINRPLVEKIRRTLFS